jgi:hypothetical protein
MLKKFSFTIAVAFILASLVANAQDKDKEKYQQQGSQPISSDWFAMHAIAQSDPWPTEENIQFSSWRSVSAGIYWGKLNPTPGVYEWTYFDRWMSRINQYGQTVLYTVYSTPTWASSCPTCICNGGGAPLGSCYPPNDLNADGTGTDQHLKDFLTALIQHVGPGKIQFLEVWNEPNVPSEWGGAMPQMVSMARDIRTTALALDPRIKIVCPPETGDGKDGIKMTFLADYLAAGGGAYVDIIGLHGYVDIPEDIVVRINATTAVMQQYGQTGKPIWVTEGSWCCDNKPLPVAEQPGFSTRLVLAMLSTPVRRFYAYAFESDLEENLWDQRTMSLTPNATTYQLYYKGLVGATMTQPCQPQSSGSPIWTCTFSRPNGYAAEAVWNASASLGKTSMFNVSSQYVRYHDVHGKVFQIRNQQAPIGYEPIWLEN